MQNYPACKDLNGLVLFLTFCFVFPLLPVVPPLKFGSLVDSKPFSDEESSMITQSMPTEGPKVPLNGKNELILCFLNTSIKPFLDYSHTLMSSMIT